MGAVKLLLDTCTFLWLTTEPSRLSSAAVEALDQKSSALFLSDVSIWEICLKWQAGKYALPTPPRDWCEEQVSIWKIKPLKIERSHMFRVTELPVHHRDPFDRLLVAQTIEERLCLVTPDEHIKRYPALVLW